MSDTKSPTVHAAAPFLSSLVLLVLAMLGGIAPPSHAITTDSAGDVWLLIDTRALTLTVMEGEEVRRVYENISIGSNGATRSKKMMDEKTPIGEFRISRIKSSSRFHLFLGIDYPNMDHVRRAFTEGRISYSEYHVLREAWEAGKPPPQNTRLGGYLGIHGVGAGNSEVHSKFNWTNGCVAVTNAEMDELSHWVGVGTRVSIR